MEKRKHRHEYLQTMSVTSVRSMVPGTHSWLRHIGETVGIGKSKVWITGEYESEVTKRQDRNGGYGDEVFSGEDSMHIEQA